MDNKLSNWTKVILAAIVPGLPGLGAVIGIVIGVIFMSNEDEDRKSYGKALLIISLVFLVIAGVFCFFTFLSLIELGQSMGGNTNNLQNLLKDFENIK